MNLEQLEIPKEIIESSYNDKGRLLHLAGHALLQAENSTADMVELGVAHGGSAALLAYILKMKGSSAKLHLLDSWEGLPKKHKFDSGRGETGWFGGCSRQAVERLLNSLDLLNYCIFHDGWFEDTIPSLTGEFSLIHIDCDFYEPCTLALDFAMNHLNANGVAVIDDYGDENTRNWPGVHTAVQAAIQSRPLWQIDIPVGDRDKAVAFKRRSQIANLLGP